MGKPRDFFDSWFAKDPMSTLRSIYYLPRSESTVKSDELSSDDFKLTTPPHADSGFLTLLATFGMPGLQVKIDGEFRSVKPVDNTLVVNLGETFARITNFKVKATVHQVVDIGVVRYSSPFFCDPKFST